MPKNTSVVLGDHFDEFIANQIKRGRYGSASELIRTGLRLLEDKETKIEALRSYLLVGEKEAENRDFVEVNVDQIIEELDQEGI